MGNRPPTSAPLRILIVDKHDASRIGLSLMLGRLPSVSTCVAAAVDEDAIALARKHSPAVAVIDISERGPFTASLAAALRRAVPDIRFVLTSRCAMSASAAVRGARASAFVPAGSSGRSTIHAVLAAARDIEPPTSRTAPAGALSEREREVLTLLVSGATNREIAAEMHLGPETIKKHASAIYRKLGVRNRTEASQRAPEVLATAIKQTDV
jgi:two-component system response regulator DesR